MRQELNEIQNTLQEKQSRAKALKELEESGDGYQYGVKSVLEQKQKGKFQGVIGTVSQLITVPQKYEKAIETAKNMLKNNISLEIIVECTGITLQTVEELANSIT